MTGDGLFLQLLISTGPLPGELISSITTFNFILKFPRTHVVSALVDGPHKPAPLASAGDPMFGDIHSLDAVFDSPIVRDSAPSNAIDTTAAVSTGASSSSQTQVQNAGTRSLTPSPPAHATTSFVKIANSTGAPEPSKSGSPTKQRDPPPHLPLKREASATPEHDVQSPQKLCSIFYFALERNSVNVQLRVRQSAQHL